MSDNRKDDRYKVLIKAEGQTGNKSVEDIYLTVQDANPNIRGAIHNFLIFYKGSKLRPDSKVLKYLMFSQYICLRAHHQKWNFAREVRKRNKRNERGDKDNER